jgi:RNA recognition motif-containing protein
VEFALAEDALEAIDNMDQAELYGRVIKVNQAKPQKQAGEKLGSKTAVWEQVSFLSFSTVESTLFLGCFCLRCLK